MKALATRQPSELKKGSESFTYPTLTSGVATHLVRQPLPKQPFRGKRIASNNSGLQPFSPHAIFEWKASWRETRNKRPRQKPSRDLQTIWPFVKTQIVPPVNINQTPLKLVPKRGVNSPTNQNGIDPLERL